MTPIKKFSPEWWEALTAHEVGNEVEALVEKTLKFFNTRLVFAFHRLPDTKSARLNMVASQPADYIYRCGSHAGMIEAKGLGHPYCLPKKNLSQLPTLRKWALAGSEDVILVYHYMQDKWRPVYPIALNPADPSWDLRQFLTFGTAEDALKSTGYFG